MNGEDERRGFLVFACQDRRNVKGQRKHRLVSESLYKR